MCVDLVQLTNVLDTFITWWCIITWKVQERVESLDRYSVFLARKTRLYYTCFSKNKIEYMEQNWMRTIKCSYLEQLTYVLDIRLPLLDLFSTWKVQQQVEKLVSWKKGTYEDKKYFQLLGACSHYQHKKKIQLERVVISHAVIKIHFCYEEYTVAVCYKWQINNAC